MKIYGIGLSKTGNTSLSKALRILGIGTIQAYKIDQLSKKQATVDSIAASNFKTLNEQHIDSKFILTLRDYSSWIISAKAHYDKYPKRDIEDLMIARHKLGIFSTEDLQRVYFEHNYNVINHFKDKKNKLLVLDICSGEGWSKLCSFLDLPVPNCKFPHENKTK